MGYTGCVDGEFGVALPFWVLQAVAEDPEESVVAPSKKDVAVLGLVCSVGNDGR